jgi:hypothetical protein
VALTICIATINRASFIAETLDTIISQLAPDAEIVIVDGASTDDTRAVVERYLEHPAVRYFVEATNSGVDADYDKAVQYARGRYCWLMTDDDLMLPGAVAEVIAATADGIDAIVVNTQVRNRDLRTCLNPRQMAVTTGQDVDTGIDSPALRQAIQQLTFIGSVVVRRDFWLSRERTAYFGSLFIHVGVLFGNPPVSRLRLIARPLVILRYGNAMWTPRSFEIWMFKWPALVWSFDGLPAATRAAVVARQPWRRPGLLLMNRAAGAYSLAEFRRFLPVERTRPGYYLAGMIAALPARLVNFLGVVFFLAFKRDNRVRLHDLLGSRHANRLGRFVARVGGGDVL